jgi:hypothetical protein
MRFMKSDEGGVRSGDEPQVRKEAGFGDSASELYHAELPSRSFTRRLPWVISLSIAKLWQFFPSRASTLKHRYQTCQTP